jgi:hypothetical protein
VINASWQAYGLALCLLPATTPLGTWDVELAGAAIKGITYDAAAVEDHARTTSFSLCLSYGAAALEEGHLDDGIHWTGIKVEI